MVSEDGDGVELIGARRLNDMADVFSECTILLTYSSIKLVMI